MVRCCFFNNPRGYRESRLFQLIGEQRFDSLSQLHPISLICERFPSQGQWLTPSKQYAAVKEHRRKVTFNSTHQCHDSISYIFHHSPFCWLLLEGWIRHQNHTACDEHWDLLFTYSLFSFYIFIFSFEINWLTNYFFNWCFIVSVFTKVPGVVNNIY